jgi:glycogen synthase
MKALIFTNEYPPAIYGGAGIHVGYLSRELAKLCSVEVRCFGDQRIKTKKHSVTGFDLHDKLHPAPKQLHSVFNAAQRCLDFNKAGIKADIVHVHTWYTHLGGIFAKLNYSIPLVVTAHSLEPLRPWKREQLRNGYDFSCWVERATFQMADAVVAVSRNSADDILRTYTVDPEKVHIIHNGIDPDEYRPVNDPETIRALGIDPDIPYVLFVGRITRQKGLIHFINAINYMDSGFQVVICAGSPDTREIETETETLIRIAQSRRKGIVWVRDMVDTNKKIALYSHADVFCCPSVYEPFGIINLEAMACETPVIASAVGGITEVVVEGKTGLLVSCPLTLGSGETVAAVQFERDFADKINILMRDKDLRLRMGKAGRERAVKQFSWSAIAKQTHKLYKDIVSDRKAALHNS